MAFCSSCGGQLGDGERFCGKCGADQMAKASGVPAGIPAAPPVGAPPMGTPPQMPYVSAGQIPMSVAMPPQAPAKKSGMMWLVIIAAAAVGYYYYSHHNQPTGQTPGTAPGTAPQTQPGPQAPGGSPGQAPGGQAPGGGGNSLLQQESFTGSISEENGDVEISNGKWVNSAAVAVASVTLECDQVDNNNQVLTKDTATLSGPNGPAPPNSTVTFDPFSVGQVVQGAVNANCGLTGATAAN